jgi:hypothetical protein
MMEICSGLGDIYLQMAHNQDAIGWRQFMEAMISTWMRKIQRLYHISEGMQTSPEQWAQGLILKLLKATHGQWLYCSIQIHDTVSGMQATIRKETIQKEIKGKWNWGQMVYWRWTIGCWK